LEDRCEPKELEEDLHMVEPMVKVICCVKLQVKKLASEALLICHIMGRIENHHLESF
jgi:hypothetical protein